MIRSFAMTHLYFEVLKFVCGFHAFVMFQFLTLLDGPLENKMMRRRKLIFVWFISRIVGFIRNNVIYFLFPSLPFPCKFYFLAHFLAKVKISFCKEISLQMEALILQPENSAPLLSWSIPTKIYSMWPGTHLSPIPYRL